jgi:TolB-like protein/DNA-binding winged helix-turn-helix (wHTH) protein
MGKSYPAAGRCHVAGECCMHIAFAGHEMDLLRQELRRNGEFIHVEPQVFDLLLHLVRNRDRVVSKDELFEAIWNGRIVSEAALSSRINAARKAVGDDGDRQILIKTIHKRGFRFVGAVQAADRATTPAETAPARAEQPAAPRDLDPPPLPGPGRRAGKASVVVMPLTNRSPEPDTEYFSYGLTEDIIRLLARNRWLEVLSRHSAAAFKGRDVPAQEIGTMLGVRYLVQGSVLKRGERVRIVADLVCAETGRQLWSETYDFGLSDLLQVQDAIAQQIAATIEPELSRAEREAAVRKPPSVMDAWDFYQRGLWNLWGFTTPSMAEAEVMFRRAIELDPDFARAHGALSYVHLQRSFLGEPEERPALLDSAMRYARAAVALDDRDCMNLCVLGRAHCMQRNYEDSVAMLEQSIALNPSFAQGWFALAFTLTWCGRQKEALALVERATELSPRDPHLTSFHHLRGLACFALGDLDGAATYSRMASRLHNASHCSFAVHAAALGLLGRGAEARGSLAELLQRKPAYSCAYTPNDLFFCADEALVRRFVEGLRRAGLPEHAARPAAPRGASSGSRTGVTARERGSAPTASS